MGAGIVSVRKKHVCADFLAGVLSVETKKKVDIVTHCPILLFMVMVFIVSLILIPTMKHSIVALGIPRQLYYFPIL